MQEQQHIEKKKDTSEEKRNPVLQWECAVGVALLGLLVDIVINGPNGAFGRPGGGLLIIFGILSVIAYEIGPDMLARYQRIRQEGISLLPWKISPYVEQAPGKTRVLAPPTHEEEKEASVQSGAHRCRIAGEPMPELPVKSATTTTRNLDDEDLPPTRVIPQERRIDLTADLQIDKSELVGKAIFICGIRRHGKTTLGARLAEQFGRHYIPMFIPCLEGDYLSLIDVLPRVIVASHSRMDQHYSAYDFAALDDSQAAYKLGYDILDRGYQVVFDMSPYTSIDQAISLEINVIRGMFHWANTHPNDRVPAHVFKDEAQRYLPQNLSDSVIADPTILKELLRVYMDIIAIGGKRGIAPVILTQRFAQVNKKIMAQSEVFFLLRQTNDGDLDRCMEYVDKEIATRDDISKFQPGQGVYIAYDGSQLVTHFKKRRSSDERSSTPKADAALRYKTMPMTHEMVQARREEKTTNPPLASNQASIPTTIAPKPSHREKYAPYIAIWERLEREERATMRNFAECIEGITEARAYKLLCDMSELDLIHWERKKTRML